MRARNFGPTISKPAVPRKRMEVLTLPASGVRRGSAPSAGGCVSEAPAAIVSCLYDNMLSIH